MTEQPDDDPMPTLDAAALAAVAGSTAARIDALTAWGVLHATGDPPRYRADDAHVVRLFAAFEAAGVPVEALRAAAASGRIDFSGYHVFHRAPDPASPRTYAAFRADVDPDGRRLAELFTAFGLAEPGPEVHLTSREEALIARLVDRLGTIADRDLAVRAIRLHGEAARRATEATLDVYEDAARRLGPDPASIDSDAYAALSMPWAALARDLPTVAGWLHERHLRGAIDGFSVDTTEQLLAADGYLPPRSASPPGIAFVDLTGFTRATVELGDEGAAALSLTLGELARATADRLGGRLVKLLGDGALLHLRDGPSAVTAALDLVAALRETSSLGGHAGVHVGPVIEREGDVFGRTVNLAARLADRAPDGAVYVTGDVVAALGAGPFTVVEAGSADLQGIGPTALYRVER